jgi:DNA-binding NarL/FixJ family response regulator
MLQQSGFKVRGYITENQLIDIAKAVRVVSEGEAWLPRKLVAEMLNHFETA